MALADAYRFIDELLASRRRDAAVPGMAVGIVCRNRLVWAKGYGVLAVDDASEVSPRTLFRIASVTKVFTALAIARLADAGALDLDDPVRKYLPWFELRRSPDTGTAPVTIRQLLTHSGGMPRDSRLTDFSRLFQPARNDAIAALPAQRLEATPGTAYAYSNLGYGILGEVIRAASSMSYDDYLERAIFAPLGMTHSLAHPSPDTHTAWGHGPRRADGTRAKAGFWELGIATPAGGMASSVADLGRFVIDQLALYAGAEPRLLSRSSMRDMHRVQFALDPARGGAGLGWAVETSSGQHLVYHGGELPEQTSFVLIDLNALIGVIVLTNAQDVDANGMAQAVLAILRRAVVGASSPEPAIPSAGP